MSVGTLSRTTHPQKFNIDPEVNELNDELKSRERTAQQSYARKTLPAMVITLIACTVWAYFIALEEAPQAALTIVIGGGVITLLSLLACAKIFRLIGTPEHMVENQRRKENQRSMKRSIRTARSLSETVPVLTKSHVEAGIRFDQAVAAHKDAWKPDDVKSVRALLLSDLSRESTILSLIEDRGLTTADAVTAVLAEMETNTKPLQDGWL